MPPPENPRKCDIFQTATDLLKSIGAWLRHKSLLILVPITCAPPYNGSLLSFEPCRAAAILFQAEKCQAWPAFADTFNRPVLGTGGGYLLLRCSGYVYRSYISTSELLPKSPMETVTSNFAQSVMTLRGCYDRLQGKGRRKDSGGVQRKHATTSCKPEILLNGMGDECYLPVKQHHLDSTPGSGY